MELFILDDFSSFELQLSRFRIMKKIFDVPSFAKPEYSVRFLDILVQLCSYCSIKSNLLIFAMAKNLVQTNCLETKKALGQLLLTAIFFFFWNGGSEPYESWLRAIREHRHGSRFRCRPCNAAAAADVSSRLASISERQIRFRQFLLHNH